MVNRPYDVIASPAVKDAGGNITTYAKYNVYLPITDAPEKTPEQEAGLQPQSLDDAPPAAPAPASSAEVPAESASAVAPAEAASAGQ